MKLSVIIPVHNEKETISEIVHRVRSVHLEKEIIIVDDKSTDGTDCILRQELRRYPEIRLIFQDKNRGKGFAIRTALRHVTGDIVIIQDADLEYDPNDYKRIIAPFENPQISVVYGSRFQHLRIFAYLRQWTRSRLKGETCSVGHIYLANFLCIKLLNWMVQLLYGQGISDEATCYKAFRSGILKQLKLRCTRFEFCPEVTAKISKSGHRIFEVPISYTPRTTEHGKKIGWKDGLMAIVTLIRYRFMN